MQYYLAPSQFIYGYDYYYVINIEYVYYFLRGITFIQKS